MDYLELFILTAHFTVLFRIYMKLVTGCHNTKIMIGIGESYK